MKQILIVEDSKVQQTLLMGILEEQGYNVHVVDDGLKAIKLATGKKYDLILLDINMEGMTGMAVLSKVKDSGASTNANVIMITSENEDETVKAAI